ncbi:hypothetical protein MLD38_022583 [Melastoma candidum]|uniref:Uncharacterized protein n=1 Tax=Melastoma candidum TaxID=119954 RepID=A0ACB9QKX5_9MYRT|nr:hypothetical protein MLD38_022583 [Melastoma candidum]
MTYDRIRLVYLDNVGGMLIFLPKIFTVQYIINGFPGITRPEWILSNTYGTAFPLKMDLDRQILSRFQRPAGAIPSSMLGLEALTGSLDNFGFEDYLNDPRESESFRPSDMHHGMEVRLGMSKGPVCPSFM